MKRIAISFAVLALSAGAAFAATPAMPATHHHPMHHVTRVKATMSMGHEAQRMTSALNLLEAKGYASFSNFKQDGANFSATVTKNGQNETLVVDPDSGTVTAQS
jgi:hypothetical protein